MATQVETRRGQTAAQERVVAWPASGIPQRYLRAKAPRAELIDGVIWEDPAAESIGELHEPDPRTFLALYNLRLTEAEIVEFVRQHGSLRGGITAPPEPRPAGQGRVRRGFFPIEEQPSSTFSTAVERRGLELDRLRTNAARRFRRKRRRLADESAARDEAVDRSFQEDLFADFVDRGELLDEFLYGARCFRDLYRAFLWASGQETDEPAWESDVWAEPGLQPPRDEVEASAFLVYQLTAALGPFTPMIQLIDGDSDAVLERLRDTVLPFVSGRPEIAVGDEDRAVAACQRWGRVSAEFLIGGYAVCCRQLFNHIAVGARAKVCAAPDCENHHMRTRSPYCRGRCAKRIQKRAQRSRNRGRAGPRTR